MGVKRKYRPDEVGDLYPNGSVPIYTRWMGGPSLAEVRNCPTPIGPRTVYVTGEADTFFSVPAACTFKRRTVCGYVTSVEGGYEFNVGKTSWLWPHVMEEQA